MTRDIESPAYDQGVRRSALGWQSIATIVGQVAQTAMTLVVAASTSPGEFALWAVAAIVVNAQNIIGNLGLGPALIFEDLGGQFRKAVDTAFVATTVLAVALTAGIALLAVPFSGIFGSGFSRSDVIAVIGVMSLVVGFTTMSGIPQAILERGFAFRARALADTLGSIAYVALTLGLLVAGLGVWSLIIAKLVQTAGLLVVYWLAAPVRPSARWSFSRDLFRRLFRYGKYLTFAGLINFLAANLDNIALGTLSASALGAYALAYSITNVVPTFLTQTVGKVSFPIYARLRSTPDKLEEEFAATLQTTAIVVLPATIALALFGPEALVAVFGEDWRSAGSAIIILAFYGLFRSVGSAGAVLMNARGHVRAMTVAQVLALVASIALLIPLLDYGAVGVAWAFTLGQAASTAFIVAMTRWVFTRRTLRLLMWPALAAALGATAGGLLLLLPVSGAWVVSLVIFFVVYGGVLFSVDPRARHVIGLTRLAPRG